MSPADLLEAQQTSELNALAKTKDRDAVDEAANTTACDEDDDGGLHPILDEIHLGLRGSSRKVFVVSHDDHNHAIFIADTFEEVKAKIEALPNL